MIKTKRMRWVVHAARMEMRNVHKISAGKPEEKKLLGIPRHGWEDDIKMNLKEILLEGVD
jgi:hypothetical protein